MQKLEAYKMSEIDLTIPCYAEEAVRTVENEEVLRRQVQLCNKVTSAVNIVPLRDVRSQVTKATEEQPV